MAIIEGSIPRDAVTQAVISGGAAGDLTVTGIKARDLLVSVLQADISTGSVVDIADLTTEFTITADDTINNTGGTATTGDKLIVTWLAVG